MRTPISEHHRLSSIDTLRGFALLGILVMNIQSFAMISAAYTFPNLHMDISGLNLVIWTLSHIFADLKFMAIFSMLFGAGVILATQRRDQAGKRRWTYHYARTFWLLIFGMIHAYFIWYGDILVTYALCGFVVYWFRNLSAPTFFFIGGISLLIALLIMMSAGVAPADVQQGILRDFVPNTAEIDREIAAYRGTWSDVQNARLIEALDIQFAGIPFFLFWWAGGLMLIGHNWDPSFSLLQHGGVYNYLGSIGVALFYVGCIMLISKKTIWHALQARLAAVGRMAFTNYILQSVIATALFYGYGLFGSVER